MKRFIPAVFVLFAAVLAFFFLSRNLFVKENVISRAKVVIPIIGGEGDEDVSRNGEYAYDAAQTSFIQLANGETLISTVECDLDGDGFDDQINIVKTASGQNIVLVPALYNARAGSYERIGQIQTEIVQVNTFACTSLDVTGTHTNSVVYQGISEGGTVVMKIFNGKKEKNGSFSFEIIGDFEADGTIFIHQEQRSEAYELAQTKGKSFPVWVYTSESPESGSDSSMLDQIQTMYDWSENDGKYVAVQTVRVAGNRVAAKELARIQDGTVATFGKFLDGLWYKTENPGSEMRFIFFDYSNSEIIFEYESREEVYSWLNSNLRRNGIYFSAVNKSIENLHRRFDISLVNVDEIRIKLQDDVRMLISESTLWDGNYKKFTSRTVPKTDVSKEREVIDELVRQSTWSTSDGVVLTFSKTGYQAVGSTENDSGRFTENDISGSTLIQFRSDGNSAFFRGAYLPSFQTKSVTEKNSRGRSVEKTIIDKETLVLQSVVVSPNGFYNEQRSPLVLHAYTPPKEDAVAQAEEIQSYTESVSTKNPAVPKLSVGISPQYFSPDGDGEYDELRVSLGAECSSPLKEWSFVVEDPETLKPFWKTSGTSEPSSPIRWNGRGSAGEIVQSATDYPYTFTVVDSEGLSNTAHGYVKVDVLVIKEGDRIKMQVPSIIFRSDAADFKSDEELRASADWDGKSKGLDARTIENNVKVLSRISEILKKFRDYSVTIEGNANNLSGTQREEEEVRQLSEARAKFVRAWLIKDGVSASKLTAVGNGSKNPATTSTLLEDRWKNRRVEFILKK